MAIHARNPSLDPHSDPSCMSPSFSTRARAHSAISSDFYNYFQHGIDFLISGTTHVVIKIVLHTNIVSSSFPHHHDHNLLTARPPARPQPGTPLFQRYKRCPWQIEGRPEDDEDGASLLAPRARLRSPQKPSSTLTDSPPCVRFDERVSALPPTPPRAPVLPARADRGALPPRA